MGTADLNQRLANLSPAKKALLELRFKQDRLHEQTIPLRASREFDPPCLCDDLCRISVDPYEIRTQDFVAGHDQIQRSLQCRYVENTA